MVAGSDVRREEREVASVTDRIMSLQILRFVAASMVVLHHSAGLAKAMAGSAGVLGYRHLSDVAGAGVDIFFVISGFIITRTGPLAEPRPTGAQFFLRRWGRVAPLFYVLTVPTLLTYGIASPVSPYGAGGPLTTGQTIATLFFWPSAGEINVPPYLSNGWTLCFEMLFYTAVSFVLIGGKLRRNVILIILMAILCAIGRWWSRWNGFEFLCNPILLEFGFGIALAFMWPRVSKLPAIVGVVLVALGLLQYALLSTQVNFGIAGYDEIMRDEEVIQRVLQIGVPSAFIVSGFLILDKSIKLITPRIIGTFGDASYSIFLAHGLVILYIFVAMKQYHETTFPGVIIVGAVVASIFVGYLTYAGIEVLLLSAVRRRLPGYRPSAGIRLAGARDIVRIGD